ncbi:mannosyltransferase [Kocuria flava]|uniref:Glycosyl transferase n=1 Tax=Kocuria flava TaxID=446860 RepID=A0A0U3GJ52_9MICC|nr:glycosyltransferase family 1 protein [Kocuria flava]ALU40206.1 mannosyltransferase [Kocuria flava]GEO93334.1 glycosyl transferase [Kocuria flava]
MRLLLDARYTRPEGHDGISRYGASLIGAVAALAATDPGLDPAVLVSDRRQLAALPELPHVLGPSPVSAAEAATGLLLRRVRPDVVFSPMQTMGSAGRRHGLVLTLHDLIYYDHPEPPADLPPAVRVLWRAYHRAWWPQRLLLDRADAVVTVSHTTRELIAAHRLTRRPVHVVPNAAQPGSVVDDATALARLPHREPVLVYMGSFLPYKNVETLLRAAARLPDHELHLLSRVPPARRAELEARTPPGARVVFHDGVGEDEYRDLLARAAALLTASRAEGYGLPVVEALAAGTPVVCSDLPIFREVAGDAAAFARSDDDAGFAAAVRALQDPARARAQVLAGLDRARAYSWEDSARRLLEVARGVHARRTAPRP